ncbi:hypothetical protein J6590_040337 [Homalodisca vitripennis]|nr:hypothetical protein J6590_040337 [Homalodisca vitripennis]
MSFIHVQRSITIVRYTSLQAWTSGYRTPLISHPAVLPHCTADHQRRDISLRSGCLHPFCSSRMSLTLLLVVATYVIEGLLWRASAVPFIFRENCELKHLHNTYSASCNGGRAKEKVCTKVDV